jgi:hypothetical protein
VLADAHCRALVMLLLAAALLGAIAPSSARAAGDSAPETSAADGWVTFTANWTAAGHEHTLVMGERRASTFELTGPFVVTAGDGLSRGFFARAIGFVDSGAIGIGRLVLEDAQGEAIYTDLRGQQPGTGRRVEATITGGTGRYAGIEGGFAFDWQYVLHTEDGSLQGRSVDLRGRYRRTTPTAAAPRSSP